MITATAVTLALAVWAKGMTLAWVRRRLDAEFAEKFQGAL